MADARVAKLSRDYSHSRAQTERDIPRGRGGYINYYEDLGMSTTEEGYQEWKVAKKKYDSQISSAKKQMSEYEQEINNSKSDIPSKKSAMQAAWKKTSADFVPIKVWNGKEVEGTYRLSKADAQRMAKDPALYTNFVNGALYVGTKAGGRTIGQELHDGLLGGMKETRKKFNQTVGPQVESAIAKAQSQYNSQINAAKGNLTAAREQVAGYERLNQDQMNALLDKYRKRGEALKSIYDSIYVKDAQGEDNGTSTIYSAIAAGAAAPTAPAAVEPAGTS